MQVIQEVVPVLAQTLRDQKKDLISATAEILLSFAAAFEHIAPHRRLHLYSMLAQSLGMEESLFAIIATLVDRFSKDSDVDRFAANLFSHGSSVQALTVGLLHLPCLFSTSLTLYLDNSQTSRLGPGRFPTKAKTLIDLTKS